jgi:hypothetical protein
MANNIYLMARLGNFPLGCSTAILVAAPNERTARTIARAAENRADCREDWLSGPATLATPLSGATSQMRGVYFELHSGPQLPGAHKALIPEER